MAFNDMHKAFMVECYLLTSQKIDGVWQYSIQNCIAEFEERYPDTIPNYKAFRDTLMHCVDSFRQSGSILKKKGSGPPLKRSHGVVENVRQIVDQSPQTSIRRISQLAALSYETC